MPASNEIATVRIPETTNINGSINIRFGEFTVELQTGCDPQRVFEVLRMMRVCRWNVKHLPTFDIE